MGDDNDALKGLKCLLLRPSANANIHLVLPTPINMVSSEDPTMTPSPSRRGEIDTSLPYEHVSEAVSLFGAKIELFNSPNKSTKSAEKRESPVFSSLKHQINEAEITKNELEVEKATIEDDLAKLKLCNDELTRKLEELSKNSESAHAKESELKNMYTRAMDELQAARITIEKLQMDAESAEIVIKKAAELEARAEVLSRELEAATRAREDAVLRSESETEGLKGELEHCRAAEETVKEQLKTATLELEALKVSESRAVAALGEVSVEIQAVKARLKEAEDERAALLSTKRYLEAELESSREGSLAAVESVEVVAAKLAEAKVAEAKVAGTEFGLEEAFIRVVAEQLEAEVVAMELSGMAEMAEREKAEAVLATENAEKVAAECMAEARRAKEAEAEAWEKLRRADGAGESDLLVRRKLAEMEEETQRKIASVISDVEKVRANEADLKRQLEEARAEIEASKEAARLAQERAGSAEAAKTAVEGKLRKLRGDPGQRRKMAAGTFSDTTMTTTTNTGSDVVARVGDGPVFGGGTTDLMSGGGAKVAAEERRSSAESLGQLLQMKVPTATAEMILAEDTAAVLAVNKTKKKKLFAKLGAIFLLRSTKAG